MIPTPAITEPIATIISGKTPRRVIGTKPIMNKHAAILEKTPALITETPKRISPTRKIRAEIP